MDLNRRQFVLLTASLAAGCQTDGGGNPTALGQQIVDAGPLSNYAADGLYDQFRDRGFFVVRSGPKLLALSSVCTHRRCPVILAPDRASFYCTCHGSTFDAAGKVTKAPATRDLPILPTSTDDKEHLLVTVPIT